MLKRIGVFVCHCGLNIAGSVDVPHVVEAIREYPGVAHAENYIYMCSDPGQDIVRQAIKEHELEGIVMCNCSPMMHEKTFRKVAASEGLNPYFCEIANIREHCSWPHEHEKELATKKAVAIIKATIEKLRRNMALIPMIVPLTKRVLVVGGGIAGMQAALDIAAGGYEVVLVERSPAIGGHANQLSGTFPTLDRPPCLIAPKIAEVASHPNIRLYTYAEVEEVGGYVGNFNIRIRQKPTFIDEQRCDMCGKCLEPCPIAVPAEFDCGLSQRKAIYQVSPQAVPNRMIIDAGSCIQSAAQGLKQSLGLVMVVHAAEYAGVEVYPGFGGKGNQEMTDQISAQVTYLIPGEGSLYHAVSSPADIHCHHDQGFVHGNNGMRHSHYAPFPPQSLVKGLAQRDGHIFHYMMLVIPRGRELYVK